MIFLWREVWTTAWTIGINYVWRIELRPTVRKQRQKGVRNVPERNKKGCWPKKEKDKLIQIRRSDTLEQIKRKVTPSACMRLSSSIPETMERTRERYLLFSLFPRTDPQPFSVKSVHCTSKNARTHRNLKLGVIFDRCGWLFANFLKTWGTLDAPGLLEVALVWHQQRLTGLILSSRATTVHDFGTSKLPLKPCSHLSTSHFRKLLLWVRKYHPSFVKHTHTHTNSGNSYLCVGFSECQDKEPVHAELCQGSFSLKNCLEILFSNFFRKLLIFQTTNEFSVWKMLTVFLHVVLISHQLKHLFNQIIPQIQWVVSNLQDKRNSVK